MRAAIIGASEESLHTIEKAHELGLEVVALDGNPNAAGLKVADIPIVVNISDEEATLDVIKKLGIDFNLTVPIGRYLTTIGYVNDALNLPGISKASAVLCTDKYAFHNTLADNNLRNCHCYLVNKETADSIIDKELNYPAILKPRFGSGSRAIHYLAGANDLRNALSEICDEDFVLEECMDGDEYGFDAAVIDGVFHLILLRKKDNTPLPARQAVAYYSVNPQDSFYKDVYKYCKKIAEVLGLDECLMHGDIIRTSDGPFAVEISARPSGHNLHNLFTPLCTDIDMAEEYIKHRLSRPCTFTPSQTKNMMIHYFDQEGTVTSVPSREEMSKCAESEDATLVDYVCNIKPGDKLESVSTGHSLMSRGYFIISKASGSPFLKSLTAVLPKTSS